MKAITLMRKNCVELSKNGQQLAIIVLSSSSAQREAKIAIKAPKDVVIDRREIKKEDFE